MAEALDPRPFVEGIDPRQVLKNGVDMVQQSFETVRQTVTPSAAS
jgi:hypothetical protein